MDYNRVALFVRVVKAGSFTAAAAELGLPKSSVSRNITHLEEDLGVRLLQRTTRSLALTEAGQSFYESVRHGVSVIDEADSSAREHGAEPRGTVRITLPPDGGSITAALVKFARNHPGLRLEFVVTSRFVDLVAEGIDLAVRAGRLEDSSLIARRVGTTEVALVAAPSYLRRAGRPKNVADLARHEWVLYRATNGRATITLKGPGGVEESVEARASVVADDMGFCRAALIAGAGIGVLPAGAMGEDPAGPLGDGGALEHVLPGWSHGEATLSVVMPSARQVPARVALVRDFLVQHLGAQINAANERCTRAKAARRARAAS